MTVNSITDAGPEVRRCCDILLESPLGWCVSYMLSTAFVAAFDSDVIANDLSDLTRVKYHMTDCFRMQLSERHGTIDITQSHDRRELPNLRLLQVIERHNFL